MGHRVVAVSLLLAAGCALDRRPDVDAQLVVADASMRQPATDPPKHDAGTPAMTTRAVDASTRPMLDAGAPSAMPARAASSASGAAAPAMMATDVSMREAGVPNAAPAQAGGGAGASGVDAAAATQPSAAKPAATPSVDGGARSVRCAAGTYQGTIAGIGNSLLPGDTISGLLVLKLSPVAGQDLLRVTGKLSGLRQREGLIIEDEAPVMAEVSALLDCATHQLIEGELITTDDSNEILAGTLDGVYSDSPPSLSGTWSAEDWFLGASGTWSIVLSTP